MQKNCRQKRLAVLRVVDVANSFRMSSNDDRFESFSDWTKIGPERKARLQGIADVVFKCSVIQEVGVLFVCTHNSRRSQIAEFMLRVALARYGLQNIDVMSAGTIAAALHLNVIKALRTFDVDIRYELPWGTNPFYYLRWKNIDAPCPPMYAKTIMQLPTFAPLIAIMVCDDADRNCPSISGARYRFSLPYKDPKWADNTDDEQTIYIQKIREIGTQMHYIAHCISEKKQLKDTSPLDS